jgi:tight adherence protein C
MALAYGFTGSALPVADRLGRLWRPPAPQEEAGFKEKQRLRVRNALGNLGKLLPVARKDLSRAQRLMFQAGLRRPEALAALRGAKLALALGLFAIAYFTGIYQSNPIAILAFAGLLGFLLPDFWLKSRIRRRQHALRLALPDALDLMVICVEAGMALDQALTRVGQELRITHPELCDELAIVNHETRIGKPRLDALRDLAMRTGVEDIKALVAMLVQTERFGTSVAQSLRVHSDQLRILRRQRAEEKAAKVSVKMLLPLVVFVFPALFVAILGPAAISIARYFAAH